MKQTNKIIVNRVKQLLPNMKYKLHEYMDIKGKLIIKMMITSPYEINIELNQSWDRIKKYIETYNKNMCFNCSDSVLKVHHCYCPNCNNNFCLKCYKTMFEKGLGVIKCNYCEYEIGSQLPEDVVNKLAKEIQTTATSILK